MHRGLGRYIPLWPPLSEPSPPSQGMGVQCKVAGVCQQPEAETLNNQKLKEPIS